MHKYCIAVYRYAFIFLNYKEYIGYLKELNDFMTGHH